MSEPLTPAETLARLLSGRLQGSTRLDLRGLGLTHLPPEVLALADRAVHLTHREYPWLLPAREQAYTGEKFSQVMASLRHQDAVVATEVAGALFATFLMFAVSVMSDVVARPQAYGSSGSAAAERLTNVRYEHGDAQVHRFDPARFEDPHALIDEVHAKGVRFMVWIDGETELAALTMTQCQHSEAVEHVACHAGLRRPRRCRSGRRSSF